jgi:hypothetical protein
MDNTYNKLSYYFVFGIDELIEYIEQIALIMYKGQENVKSMSTVCPHDYVYRRDFLHISQAIHIRVSFKNTSVVVPVSVTLRPNKIIGVSGYPTVPI